MILSFTLNHASAQAALCRRGMVACMAAFFIMPLLPASLCATDESDGRYSRMTTTIGQLCKQSELIVIGRVAGRPSSEEEGLSLSVTRVLFGQAEGKQISVSLGEASLSLEEGDEVLVFASTRQVPFPEMNPFAKGFQISDHDELPVGELSLVGSSRAIIPLPGTGHFESVVQSYIKLLRGKKLDEMVYLEFLFTLHDHKDPRVKEDAAIDAQLLIRFLDKETLGQVLAKNNLPSSLKNYALNIQAWRKKKAAAPKGDAGLSDEDLGQALKAIREGSDREKLEALATLSDQSSEWLAKTQGDWLPTIEALLDDQDDIRRYTAACLMSMIKHPDAVPVLLDGLRNGSGEYRIILWKNLTNIYGEDSPYDPRADKDVRDNALKQLEEWWKERIEEGSSDLLGPLP